MPTGAAWSTAGRKQKRLALEEQNSQGSSTFKFENAELLLPKVGYYSTMTESKIWGWYHHPGDGHKKVRVRNRKGISTKRMSAFGVCEKTSSSTRLTTIPLWAI